jgi:hypothetical protein
LQGGILANFLQLAHAAHARSSSRGVNPSQHSYLPELVDTPVGFRAINPA